MPALSQVTEFGPTSSVHLFPLKGRSTSSDNQGFELFLDKNLQKKPTLISAQISFFSPFSWKESFTSLTKMTTEASACKSLLTPCTSLPDNRQTTKSNSSSKSTRLMVSRNHSKLCTNHNILSSAQLTFPTGLFGISFIICFWEAHGKKVTSTGTGPSRVKGSP